MPINLATAAVDEATTDVTYGGETSKVTYRPNVITQAALTEMDTKVDGNMEFLVKTVVSWDVMLAPKKKLPITVEALKTVPLGFVRAVILAILGDREDGVKEQGKP